MSGKATAVAPSNIAFVKYWGTRDEARTLPANPSISMTLERCVSRTTVEHRADGGEHQVLLWDGGSGLEPAAPAFAGGVTRHLDRLKEALGAEGSFRVATGNTFPTGAGLASSASGFTAVALATLGALGRDASSTELSALARASGSGSAARSAMGGYVEWPVGEGDAGNHAQQIAEASHWALADVVAVVDSAPKEISSREGHRAAPTSPHFARRLEVLEERLATVREAIAERSMERLGPVLEEEAIELHLIAMSSRPPIFYWRPGTLAVLEALRAMRAEGLSAWGTIDAGPNVHVICPAGEAAAVAERLGALEAVEQVIEDVVGEGPRLVEEHLF